SSLCASSRHEKLNSTPLNGTILYAEKLIKDFMQKNKVQIMNTIFITDGGATDGFSNLNNVFDPITKINYDLKENELTNCLFSIFKRRTGTNIYRYFLSDGIYSPAYKRDYIIKNGDND